MNQVAKGRIVLYRQHAWGEPHVAIIVKVWDDSSGCVNLKVFDENGEDYRRASVLPGYGAGQYAFPVIGKPDNAPSPVQHGDR